MKYWFGYLVAAILAAITWALDAFAQAHTVLVDMVYPYISRLVLSTLADWSGAMSFNLWQVLLLVGVAAVVVSIVLMILFRWNFVQWLGWVLTAVSFVALLNTAIYSLNKHTSPLADDIRLEITDYTVDELSDAAIYFRDKANELANSVQRDKKGNLDIGSFEELAQLAGEGFQNLTYNEAMSVFAGSTAPAKEQGWFRTKGDTGMMIPLTGEVVVNPNVPNAAMPFAIGKEMAHRMSIYGDADAGFASILAGMNHSDTRFQYSAYLMAYYYCYATLEAIPTDSAAASARAADSGVNTLLRTDLDACEKFFGDNILENEIRIAKIAEPTQQDATQATEETSETAGTEATGATETIETQETAVPTETTVSVTFSSYTTITDILTSWHIQTYVAPLYQEQETPFDPLDPNQVDISGLVNTLN